MARKTTTKSYAKSLARSGPELQPSQIRLADEAQTDKGKVFTQTDVNQGMGSGGGGADLTGYAKTNYVDSADNALNDLLATETQARKDGDAAASYQLQQAEIGLEAKIEANTAAIEAIEVPEGGGSDPSLPYALVISETDSDTLPPKEKSASEGVATTQILETITLQDASGNSLGDVHFESGSGIGVAMSTRYANTIYIQGGQLQNGIEANAEKIEELEAASDDLALVVAETDDASFGMDEETGQMGVLASIQLKGGDEDKGRVWFQGGGGTGISLDGDTIRVTTTQMYDRVKENEAKIEANTKAIEQIEIPESGGGGEPQTLESVLAAGNEAGPGQSIRMHLDESDLENIQEEIEANIGSLSGGKQREAINIEGRSGLRLGAAVSTYTFNEPFHVDLDEGEVSLFQACHRKMTAAGDLFTGGTSEGSYTEAKFGIGGFSYWSDFCVNISIHGYGYTVDCKNDAGEESLKIHWHRSSNRSYVKANEFIGDGSKLTGVTKNAAMLTALQAATTFEELRESLIKALEES